MTSEDVEQQRQNVEGAMSGKYLISNTGHGNGTDLNDSIEIYPVGFCPPHDQNSLRTMLLVDETSSQRTLKMIALSGCFLLLWGIYCSFDISLNTQESKQKSKVTIMQLSGKNAIINNFAKDIVNLNGNKLPKTT